MDKACSVITGKDTMKKYSNFVIGKTSKYFTKLEL